MDCFSFRELVGIMQQQQEIKFFWPLTEQIPLELDYTGCEKPKIEVPDVLGLGLCFAQPGTWGTTVLTTSTLEINTDTTTFTVADKPNMLKRGLLHILGIKWKVKG